MGLEGPSSSIVEKSRPGRVVAFGSLVDHAGGHLQNCNTLLAGHDENDHADHQSDHQSDESSLAQQQHCSHVGDPHLWLDPTLMKQLVAGIDEHLTQRGAAPGAARVAAVLSRIDEADRLAGEVLADVAGGRLITQHDAWRRYAAAYDLQILGSVLPAGVGQPTAGDMARALDAIEMARQSSNLPIAIMTEPQLNPRVAQRVAQSAEVPLGVLEPLGDGDWFALHVRNARVIADTLTGYSSVAGISPP